MKTIFTIAAVAALIASPALAAQMKQRHHVRSLESYAQVQPRQTQRHSTNPRFDVYQNGQYVGSDPDPMVRFQLQREDNNTGD
jgi:opacity protein-like surface antigen